MNVKVITEKRSGVVSPGVAFVTGGARGLGNAIAGMHTLCPFQSLSGLPDKAYGSQLDRLSPRALFFYKSVILSTSVTPTFSWLE